MVISLRLSPADREEFWTWWAMVWPSWVSFAAFFSMDITDSAFLGHLHGSGALLPAASSASVIMGFTGSIFVRGPGGAVATLSANAFGAKQDELAGRRLQAGLAISLGLSLLVCGAWIFPGEILADLAHTSDMDIAHTDDYGRFRLVGLLPVAAFTVLQSWLAGRKNTRVAMYSAVIACAVNIGLNQLLIYGALGWDGWGFDGSPVATALSRWVTLFMVTWWSWDEIRRCWPATLGPSFTWARLRDFLSLGVPLTISGLLEEFTIQLAAVFAAHLGQAELATHNSMLIAFMFLSSAMTACMQATSSRVSHHMVVGDLAGLWRVIRIAGRCMLLWSFIVMVAFTLMQDKVGQIFSADPEVAKLSGQTSFLVGIAYFVLSVFFLVLSVLEGIARPSVVMVAFLVGCYVVGIPTMYLCGFKLSPHVMQWWPYFEDKAGASGCGLLGIWLGLSAGYLTTTMIATSGCVVQLRKGEELIAAARNMAEVPASEQSLVRCGDGESVMG